jgi:rubrerythrin
MKGQEAIKEALQTEKNAMDFYELGAKQLRDKEARRMFEQLAKEEKEHARQFYKAYSGPEMTSFEEFMSTPPEYDSDWMASIQNISSDFSVQKALEVAMEKESDLEQTLLAVASTVKDPEVRELFQLNARETHNHYLTIESEYSRLMAMVDESDVDSFKE